MRGIVIASVVPPMDWILRQFCERDFGQRPLFIEPGVKTGLPILTDNPAEVGADRVANCVGAFHKYGGPTIVVDFGTATNFDVVSKKGQNPGGAIAPGLYISAEALFARAARLPRVEIRRPDEDYRYEHGRQSSNRFVLGTHRPGRFDSGAHDGGAWERDQMRGDRRARSSDCARVEIHFRRERPAYARGTAPDLRSTSCRS